MTHLIPNLMKGLGIRFALHQQLSMWDAAAADVVSALTIALLLLQEEAPPEPLMQEFATLLEQLHALSQAERAQLYAALGEWAEVVKELVEE